MPPDDDKPPNTYQAVVGLIIILNDLSVVLPPAVARPVNETVVEAATSVGSPVIAPVELFKANPAPVRFVAPVSE